MIIWRLRLALGHTVVYLARLDRRAKGRRGVGGWRLVRNTRFAYAVVTKMPDNEYGVRLIRWAEET